MTRDEFQFFLRFIKSVRIIRLIFLILPICGTALGILPDDSKPNPPSFEEIDVSMARSQSRFLVTYFSALTMVDTCAEVNHELALPNLNVRLECTLNTPVSAEVVDKLSAITPPWFSSSIRLILIYKDTRTWYTWDIFHKRWSLLEN